MRSFQGLLFLLTSGLTAVFLPTLLGCSGEKWEAQEAKLRQMVNQRVSKQELIAILGRDFVDYSRDGTNAEALAASFAREPNKLVSVQEKSAKWPHILYYSTPDLMTWVFLDERDRVVDFALGAQ